MKRRLLSIAFIAIFAPLTATIFASDRTCGHPGPTCENTCNCEKCRPLHKHCCCLRNWFVIVEPPDVDVIEAVGLRRVPAPVSSAAVQFQIRAVPGGQPSGNPAGEPACSTGAAAVAPVAAPAAEADCKSTAEVQALKTRMEGIDARLERLTQQLEVIAKDRAGK
ncbi:MAG: hypothetical protein J0M17_16365 [Planctomycetes bacterium]|nr:hypothetical protein [Planctomycetota bacterium]